ncbi:MAG: multidrug effflux MFS transporter [Bacteroidota bacterium]|nr:multidrug effflux MFS transporter [Bacteroidota bacterium]MDP4216526.1 multidrug effflux MFS transporter [Bacteroidota bacterium]MDP4248425.1 multidrug effflux MFS transporter [Bacteroidota bacterium]MDP4254526.1 multidrug effflux MFS transporter [Bacteroidota bacterium]MDP4257447.1 multidrug effflux MFS transporter [Bacteroidota bacterium]
MIALTRKTYVLYVVILGLLTTIGPFSIDMYLPGFDDIARSLGTSPARVALSLSSYFIGISAGQLIYGPLLDRYGRKRPLFVGLGVYIIATLICMEAKDINTLIALRLIQALGSCGAQVTAMAMVRDLFGAKESARVFSLLLLVIGLSPMIAPTAGGYVVVSYGWRTVFLILAILGGLITLLTIFFLPESYPPDKSFSLKPGQIIRNFIAVLRIRQFLIYVLVESFAFAGLFAYVSGSPILFMNIFHVDKRTYGWIFAFLSVAFIGLSQFNSRLLRRYTGEKIIRVALTGQVLVSVAFLAGTAAGWYGLGFTIFFLFLFLAFLGFTYPNAAALALAPFDTNAGTASSLLGFLQLGIGALASIGVGAFTNGTALPMVAIIAGTSVTAFVICLLRPPTPS